MYKVLEIIRGTTVDGPGFRTSIYLSGCRHNCVGCHNPQSWDPEAGEYMELEQILEIVKEEDFNVTLSGGDPLYNPSLAETLIKALKKDHRNVWIYTGYTWQEIKEDPKLLNAVRYADVIVDGKYEAEYRDPDLIFRGSSNQRIIDIQKSLQSNKTIILERE